jgi:SAM-dependent methyltransferase
VVLFRQELFMTDTDVVGKIRKLLLDENVAIAGLEGASNIHGLAWWECERRGFLGDEISQTRFSGGRQSVDVIDGSFIVLNKWALQNLRFDARISSSFDGIAQDLCMQARAAGKSVVVDDIDALSVDVRRFTTVEFYRWAETEFRNKWSASLAPVDASKLSTRLDLGGGLDCGEGWLNLDPEHGEGEFKRGAQEAPWPIPDNHVTMIWAHHVMEHVHAGGDRIRAMNEAWRVLKPGGLFEIRLPMFPHWAAVADPTHVSFWVPQSFHYFTGELGADADYGLQRWELESLNIQDEWELRGVLRKPIG